MISYLVQSAYAGPAEEGAALKAKGDAAFDARRFAEALESYEGALEKKRDARLHYNIAQVLSALGRYAEALVSYQAFIAEVPELPGCAAAGSTCREALASAETAIRE